MSRSVRVAVLLSLLLVVPLTPALAQDREPGEAIEWITTLPAAMAKAKQTGKILLICVNAKFVEGRETEEPAAKGLREVVYRDARVIERSRAFVCVMLTPKSSAVDYGELRALGIEGKIVSPQHIFVNSAGSRILLRREYWSVGKGEAAVKALLEMMDKAEKKAADPDAAPEVDDAEEDADAAPKDGEARTKWIAEKVKLLGGSLDEQKKAIRALVRADKDGDCVAPLIALLEEKKKDADLVWRLIRALGRDGLTAAALPVSKFLGHKDESIRANAAVSLEYIGSRDKKVVAALMKAATKQKDEAVANHMYRALGRCGVENAKARALLLKMTASAKSEFASFGPAIGLGYFTGDEKAARGVEKILKQIGLPGGRRGGGANSIKRGLLAWTLASIASKKSGKFMRDEMIAKLENMRAFWVEGLRNYWLSVARVCEGEESEMAAVEGGLRVIVGFAKRFALGQARDGMQDLMDEARKGRDNSDFTPKGDYLLGSPRDE
jgi:hypothetical protein